MSDFLGSPTFATDVSNFVQGLNAGDDMAENSRELGVHVSQNDTELRGHLKTNIIFVN